MSRTAYLILENGTVFEGKAFGAEKETIGELVFTTSMIGYNATITDANYFGQVVLQTFPLIGNYGVISSERESECPSLNAYIVREWCQVPSNFRCEGDLDTFLQNVGVPGIYGIDTRSLTRIVRDNGVLNCKLSYSPEVNDSVLEEIRNYKITDAVKSVVKDEVKEVKAENASYKVVLMNFGTTKTLAENLVSLGCDVTIVPGYTSAEDVLALNPDGVVLSDGPGDPAENTQAIEEIKKICDANVPVFGVSLGHQLLALSQGAKTVKLKYGHRGASQPSKYLETGRVYITTQNFGYAVDANTLPENAKLSFVNCNDNTCEGIDYTGVSAYSVQFHPDFCGGPQDTSFIFDRFINTMKDNK